MNKLFRPKCLRRVLLCLALLFPIIYLCGGLFFALAGSHGNYDWHENTLVNRDYDEVMKTENFKYSDWDWENEHGTRLGFSKGSYYLNLSSSSEVLSFYAMQTGVGVYSPDGEVNDFGLGYPNYFDYSIDTGYLNIGFNSDVPTFVLDDIFIQNSYTCMYLVASFSEDYEGVYAFVFDGVNNLVRQYQYDGMWSYYTDPMPIDDRNEHLIYFDDGSNLPDGVVWNDELRSYFVPTLKPIESNSLSDYIFSQPFESNNFITSLGKDLIDGSTKGFAPMNDLFRFVNANIMHFESSDGLAMFGLGYVYYAVNVLIIYEILILAVKLIMLPLKAVDLFDKKEDI